MHFLVNIPEIKDVPENCETCPFSYMDLCGIERCKLSGEETRSTHNEKLNDCRIIKGFDTPIIAFPITIHPKEPTTIEETNDGYYMECSNEETTYYITFNNDDESYDDLNMWNGEGD